MIEAGDSVLLLFCNQVTDGCETAICQSLNQKRSNDKMIFKAVLICLSKWCAWQCNIFIQLFWTTPQNETIMFFCVYFLFSNCYYIRGTVLDRGKPGVLRHDTICHKHISNISWQDMSQTYFKACQASSRLMWHDVTTDKVGGKDKWQTAAWRWQNGGKTGGQPGA